MNWAKWHLVLSKVATLEEIETYYSIVDVYDAIEALQLQAEADRLHALEMQR